MPADGYQRIVAGSRRRPRQAVTRCNSGAGAAASAGSESPTVLPESEDGLPRGVLHSDRPTDGSSPGAWLLPPYGLGSWGRGKLCFAPSLSRVQPPSSSENRRYPSPTSEVCMLTIDRYPRCRAYSRRRARLGVADCETRRCRSNRRIRRWLNSRTAVIGRSIRINGQGNDQIAESASPTGRGIDRRPVRLRHIDGHFLRRWRIQAQTATSINLQAME
jgi:hypothetical protein